MVRNATLVKRRTLTDKCCSGRPAPPQKRCHNYSRRPSLRLTTSFPRRKRSGNSLFASLHLYVFSEGWVDKNSSYELILYFPRSGLSYLPATTFRTRERGFEVRKLHTLCDEYQTWVSRHLFSHHNNNACTARSVNRDHASRSRRFCFFGCGWVCVKQTRRRSDVFSDFIHTGRKKIKIPLVPAWLIEPRPGRVSFGPACTEKI